MQIICPSCEATYAVPDEKLGGRMVKCARCSTTWMPERPPAAALAELEAFVERAPAGPFRALPAPASEPVPAPQPALPAAEPPPPAIAAEPARRSGAPFPFASSPLPALAPEPRSKGLLVAWVVSIALIGGAAAGAYAKRDGVMQAWPPSQRLYGLFGLH